MDDHSGSGQIALGDPAPRETVKGIFSAEDGTPLYFESVGEGPPLLFCYGLVCKREHWRHQLGHFGDSHRIITFDYRGHHRSGFPRNDRTLTLDWLSRDVNSLVNHLGLKEVVLLGHSLGVPVAAGAAVLMPEVVKGLVLVCGSVSNPFQGMFYTDRLDRWFRATSFLFEIAPETTAKFWRKWTEGTGLNKFLTSQFGFNPRLSEEHDVLSYLEGVHQTPLMTFHHLLKDYTRYDGRELLKQIRCHSLVLAGTEDYITPLYLQEEMAQTIPRGILERIPMGSHNAHTDLPEMVNEKIERFLDRIGYR